VTSPAIELRGVGKRYWKLVEGGGLRSLLPFNSRSRTELWSVRGLDLQVERGETLGVLGRNGSGKTTLLKMLCGVTSPTEGTVRVTGRIAPLIGVGVGFHGEMTGRENVMLNGLLLGLTQDQLTDRFDEIVRFAELAAFIDTPVKFYSSGMFVRLGFSVAVHSDPEVLLVDEVLAVGDLTYQMKCIERMQDLRDTGTTVVFVSHSIGVVRATCPRAIVLNRGRLEYEGDTDNAIARYHEVLSGSDEPDYHEAVTAGQARRVGDGATIVHHELVGPDGPGTYFARDVPLVYRVLVRFDRTIANPLFGMNILGQDGRAAYGVHSPVGMEHRVFHAGEEATVEFRLINRLGGGSYRATTAVTSADGRETLAEEVNGILFYVEPVVHSYGLADLSGVVTVDGEELREERSFVIGGESGA
jgi:ABC-type polysaccharide/polyol phosphate transport system ATPase subunit